MYVLSDMNDLELPIPEELLFNLKESKDLFVSLLDQLERMFEKSRI